MKIEKVKIEDLKVAEYNPRIELKEDDESYKRIKASIEEFGYVDPIIINKRNMVVIGGHQRLNILKNMNYKEVECVILNLDEKQEKRLNLSLNKNNGYWDNAKLEDLFNELDLSEEELFATGFNTDEIKSLNSNFIDDLLDDDFTDINKELNKFSVTFNIDKKYEDKFMEYIKLNGKQNLINTMINYIESEAV